MAPHLVEDMIFIYPTNVMRTTIAMPNSHTASMILKFTNITRKLLLLFVGIKMDQTSKL